MDTSVNSSYLCKRIKETTIIKSLKRRIPMKRNQKYEEPAMQVFELEQPSALLTGSDVIDDGPLRQDYVTEEEQIWQNP